MSGSRPAALSLSLPKRLSHLEANKKKMRNFGKQIVADYHFEKQSIKSPFVIALVLAAFAVMGSIQI